MRLDAVSRAIALAGITIMSFAAADQASAQATIAQIKQRGAMNCGVDPGLAGFAFKDDKGIWRGLDIDYCRAIAAAVLKDPDKVNYVPLTTKVRFTALKGGDVDVLIRDSTLTFTRGTQLGLNLAGVNFYAGQGFMVKTSLNAKKVTDLDGATMCTLAGATLELNIADYNRAHNIKITPLLFDKIDEAMSALEAGRCDGYTDDTGSLAGARSSMKKPGDWVVLGEVISKEPLGLLTRKGDEQWSDIVAWVRNALITAEELNITQVNAEKLAKESDNPEVRRVLGVEGDFGKMLGLDNDWALQALKTSGNFGEIYERHFGSKGLGLERGVNRLWSQGGLVYSYPFR
ncbi:MAG TPA: amino acid ABC transporter substrate-binding protein [Beijerinckiaceae bacterium]|nr:amino acid ABC transporter substrate-binding protein [Beijerinckiaceae bacterium]